MKTNPFPLIRMLSRFAMLSACSVWVLSLVLWVAVPIAIGQETAEPAPNEEPGDEALDEEAVDEDEAMEDEEEEEPVEEYDPLSLTEYSNWVDLSISGIDVSGNPAQFQRNMLRQNGATVGVNQLHWEKFVGGSGLIVLEGRALIDNHDYKITLDLSEPEIGYLRAGFRQYRQYYDGSGGFFPANDAWISLFDDDIGLDIGKAWFEAGLTKPGVPEIHFAYEHYFRDGNKDSTIWGDSLLTGGNGLRGIAPSARSIDERRDVLRLDYRQTIATTDLGIGLRYEYFESDNGLYITRRPGEARERSVDQNDAQKSNLLNAHASTQTRIHEKFLLTSSYAVTTMDSDIAGDRIYGVGGGIGDAGFRDLTGGTQLNEYLFNLGALYQPTELWQIVPALKVRKTDIEGVSSFVSTDPILDLSRPAQWNNVNSDKGIFEIAEELEARYTGFKNWTLYGRLQWAQEDGDLDEAGLNLATGLIDPLRETEYERFNQKYTLGANWFVRPGLSLAMQYYHQIQDYDYDHDVDTALNTSFNRYPATMKTQDFDRDDVNLRVTWRPLSNLSVVSRYDFQLSTTEIEKDGLSEREAGEVTTHIFSESVTWTPLPRWYLQGSFNYVMDTLDTPADELTGAIVESENDYYTLSFASGYALNARTDLQLNYNYYRADNYNDNSVFSQPYGAGAEQHGIVASMQRYLRSNVHWTLKYGFFDYEDQTSGGFNDYQAHWVYSGLKYFF